MTMRAFSSRLSLPQVTLCAASSVNIVATIRALESSMAQIDFAACKLFTDSAVTPDHPNITIVPIPRLTSSLDYSNFLLTRMVDHIDTTHCLIVQWDGHVQDALRWRSDFLDYDYIGASWPQFDDGHDVGNGGFSLRSRSLMQLCRDPAFCPHLVEDVAIGRINRDWLESRGMRFASRAVADFFSTERAGDIAKSFGYHGIWLMPQAIGADAFWDVYCGLDDRSTIERDFVSILKLISKGRHGGRRALRFAMEGIIRRAVSIFNR
jgi:hypothetical protein